ncbi:MAG: uroporphyrinogen decarboxylase family protein [Bacteroidetes bacterium]|nr:uroporphyrinogen decarboxylase family protein [Bacteroidota bacterium]
MTAYQRLTRRMEGHPVDRPPNTNIFMTFAARYIGKSLSDYYLDYRVLVEANMAMIEEFESGIAQAISDPYREAADFGAEVVFPEDGLPLGKNPLLDDPDKLKALRRPDPATGRRMSDRLNAVRLMREKVGDDIPVMGWVEGALAEASDLRGDSNLLMDLYDRPEWTLELLELCAELAIDFARAQIEAGAHIVGLGDAIGSQVSPELYRRFALPYEKKIFGAVREMGAITRLHICGDTTKILPDMVESGADIIDLDWMVDLKSPAERYGDRVSFCGNFDPVAVMLQGSTEDVYRATQECMRVGGSRSISAAGCEIPIGTPQENLHAQVRALGELGGI